MIEEIVRTGTFKRGYKALKKKHFDMSKVDKVIKLIVNGEIDRLTREYNLHTLKGNLKGISELHVEEDVLLAFVYTNKGVRLLLLALGTHDEVLKGKYNW